MAPNWQAVLVLVFLLVWGAGAVALGLPANAKGKAYLRRLPPVNGVPLDMYLYVVPDWKKGWHGPVWHAYRQQQTDPELEQLRREAWRRGRYALAWAWGFPLLTFGVVMVVTAVGSAR